MKLSRFNIAARGLPEEGKVAVYNTLTGGLVVLEGGILKDLERGGTGGLGPDEIRSLEDSGVLVQEGMDEDLLFDLFYNQIRFSSSTLDITLLTTLGCNFACSYCYEGELTQGKKHMSQETADAALSWIKARAEENRVSRIDIMYHGGEPLLNIPVIEKVGGDLTEFCGKNSIRLRSHMISNGYLLDRETAMRVKAAGVGSVKVTIDGPEDVHDSRRFLRGGGGTYRRIIKNLLDVKDILRISIGGNYTEETAGRVPELLDELIEAGLGPGAVKRVGFQPVVPAGDGAKAAAYDSGCIPASGRHEDFLMIQEEVVRRGFGRHAEPGINPCSAVIATHFTIDRDGAVYRCPALVGRPEFSVGDVRGDLRYNAEMVRCLGHNTFDNEECRNCAVLPHCLGGCRYISLVKKGNFHDIDCQKETLLAIAMDAVKRMVKAQE